jgi:hypothetical protein
VALDEHLGQRGLVDDVTYGRVWAPPGASYTVHALAPTSYDTKRARDRVRGLIEKRHGRWLLSAQAKRWLDDDALSAICRTWFRSGWRLNGVSGV